MKRFFMNAAGIFAMSVMLTILFAGCSKIGQDVEALSEKLKAAGEDAVFYTSGSSMLSSLENDMKNAMDPPPEGGLVGYLYAEKAPLGEMTCEVFVFENEGDAEKLYDYFKDGDAFREGIAEVRRSGKVVYMGYVEELDLLEK